MTANDKESGSKKNNMTEEDKENMWEHMMDGCCSDMSDEEKKKWKEKMQEMRHHMKTHGWGHKMGMMGMMGMMKGHGHGRMGGFMPMEMCKDMMSSLHRSHRLATLATPEVQGLFEDWVEQIEQEIVDYIKDKDSVDVKDVASFFKISKESAYYFLTRLAQKEKINLKVNKEKN